MTESLGLNTKIVTTLNKYGTIPVDFLAHLLDRRTSEIKEYLVSLEQEGVIEIKDEKVNLSSKATRR